MYMLPAVSYDDILKLLDKSHESGTWMCGLLFAPPMTPIGKTIMDRLDDWHHRSGDNIDFFCVGYLQEKYYPDDEPVGKLRDKDSVRQFYYSARAFHDVREKIEDMSRWKYSGESDLLLVNAVQNEDTDSRKFDSRIIVDYPRSQLNFDEMLALDIDKIVREGVYSSASRLFERVCQAADNAAMTSKDSNVLDFSDKESMRTLFRRSLWAVVRLLKLEAPLGSRHFIVGADLLEPA